MFSKLKSGLWYSVNFSSDFWAFILKLLWSQNVVIWDCACVCYWFPRILPVIHLQLHRVFGELTHTNDRSIVEPNSPSPLEDDLVLNIIFTTRVLPCMCTLFICHVFIHSGIHIHPLVSISHVCCWWIRPHNHHKHDWIKSIFLRSNFKRRDLYFVKFQISMRVKWHILNTSNYFLKTYYDDVENNSNASPTQVNTS